MLMLKYMGYLKRNNNNEFKQSNPLLPNQSTWLCGQFQTNWGCNSAI